jgi:hypothetical protein
MRGFLKRTGRHEKLSKVTPLLPVLLTEEGGPADAGYRLLALKAVTSVLMDWL